MVVVVVVVLVWWWWWWVVYARVGVRVSVCAYAWSLTLAADRHVPRERAGLRGRSPRLPRYPASKELLVVVVPQAPLPPLR